MPERLRTGGIVLVPALPVVVLFVYWAAHEGGYLQTTWAPSALIVLGLLAAVAIGLGRSRLRLSRTAAIALAALAAYTAWSYLSILWAAAPGDALTGSNRTLLYLLLFALFALLPWRPWTAGAALTLFTLGIGVLAVVTLWRLSSPGEVPGMFTDGRLTAPVGYVNGAAALFLGATLTGIALASRRELPWWLRGPLLALATASLQASTLCESRGWLFALPIVALVALVVVPQRVRFALWALPALGGTLLALPALLDVFSRADAPSEPALQRSELIEAASHAAGVALPICAGVLILGTALAMVDARLRVPARVSASANRVAAALAVLVLLGAVGAGLAATDGRPDQKIADYWDRSSGYQSGEAGGSRFAVVGSNRPDFWRVSLKAVRDHPVGGLGQDNWSRFYLLDRRSGEQPRWTHSLELRLLAHTGVVGFLLFLAFLVAALLAALRGRRRAGPEASGIAAIALLPLTVWVVHGSIDWFWEIPALSGPAFAFLALATAVMRPADAVAAAPAAAAAAPGDGAAPADPPADAADAARPTDPTSPPRPSRSVPALAGALVAGLAAVLALLAIALPYAAERETNAAAAGWIADPAGALAQLDRAESLNPLSPRAALTKGVIELELRRPDAARTSFEQAVERDPDDWFAHFGLGLADTAAGDRPAARAQYARAHALSPDEPLIDDALRRLDGRRPLTYAEAFERLRQDVRQLTGTS